MAATGRQSICAISLAYCRPESKGEDSPRPLDFSLSGLGWQTSDTGVRMPQMLLSQRTGFFQLTPNLSPSLQQSVPANLCVSI